MNDEIKYKVRALTRKDRCTLTDLVTKFSQVTNQNNLVNMLPDDSESKEDTATEDKSKSENLMFTFKLLSEMVKYISKEITPWFADLIGVTVDEFNSLPFDIEMDIIEQLIEKKNFLAFFLKLSQVRKKIKNLVIQF